eukprot:12048912-Alexandrium_andersonii.AAC.1
MSDEQRECSSCTLESLRPLAIEVGQGPDLLPLRGDSSSSPSTQATLGRRSPWTLARPSRSRQSGCWGTSDPGEREVAQ